VGEKTQTLAMLAQHGSVVAWKTWADERDTRERASQDAIALRAERVAARTKALIADGMEITTAMAIARDIAEGET
jgi:hypothetical protein